MVEAGSAHTTFWEGRAFRLLLLFPLLGFVVLSLATLDAEQSRMWWTENCPSTCHCKCSCPVPNWTQFAILWTGGAVFAGALAAVGLGPRRWGGGLHLPPLFPLVSSLALLVFLLAAMAGFNPISSWDPLHSLARHDVLGFNTPALLAYVTAAWLLASATLSGYRSLAGVAERWGLILTAANGLLATGFVAAFLSLLAQPWLGLPKC